MAFNQKIIRENLLKIYSKNSLREINDIKIVGEFYPGQPLASEEVLMKMQILSADPVYLTLKDVLCQLRLKIESQVLEKVLTQKDQVIKVLQLVLAQATAFRANNTVEIYRRDISLLFDLISGIFIEYGDWSKESSDHYRDVFPYLTDWYSFFLSYTNKYSFDLNRQFQSLLVLAPPSETINQVARFIAERLCFGVGMRGFIDDREIEYGAEIKKKVDSAIGTSISFVQVVSNSTFAVKGTNWCRYEYESFKKVNGGALRLKPQYANAFDNNMLFLIMGSSLEKVKPVFQLIEDDDWINDITAVRNFKAFYHPGLTFDEWLDGIRTLGGAIIANKYKLIESIQ